MAPKFGTSGVRGLVTQLTREVVTQYVRSFAKQCDTGGTTYVGWDLRNSSPSIAETVCDVLIEEGISVKRCGVLPTPALAFAAQNADASAIMITGSHIPSDRNGIKFYTTHGEISKHDEELITQGLDGLAGAVSEPGVLDDAHAVTTQQFIERYTKCFSKDALAGLTVGIYQHSSVARDILMEIITSLGASAVAIERTKEFVPVDTEAVSAESQRRFADWCQKFELDALLSTDGDADRPMLTDASGRLIPGDVLGVIASLYLGADTICTPVSSNSMIGQLAEFNEVHLTKIGSPYVVAAIQELQRKNPQANVVGFEANGGFLLGFPYRAAAGTIAPLLTRDCVLPMIATLAAAKDQSKSIAALVSGLPDRFTAADRIAGVPTEQSKQFIAALADGPDARGDFFDVGASERSIDRTDGLRLSFTNGEVVHLRPSGNAPEFRCYAEASTADRARELVDHHLKKIQNRLR